MIRERELKETNIERKKKGLTIKKIGQELGMTEQTVAFALRGETKEQFDKIKVFVLSYEALPKYFRQTLPTYKRTLEQLLMNGFSYWEAIRIIKD